MVKASRYLLMLTASLVLAMPAGWCCLLPGKAATVPTPASHHCCCEGPVSPAEEGSDPAPEPSSCCCDNNLPLPAKAVSYTPAGVSLLPAADLASTAQTHA